jgi:Flp pilus assembly protein TadB
VLAAAAVLCWGEAPASGVRRLVTALPRRTGTAGSVAQARTAGSAVRSGVAGTVRQAAPSWPRAAVAAAGGSLGYVLAGAVGSVAGLVLGAVVARRLPDAAARRERERRDRLRADLPWAADLLAACLAAGAPAPAAAEAVAAAVGGPVGEALRRAVALQRLGGDPPSCWLGLGADPELAAVGRALARAAESGLPAAPVISAEAALCRAERRADAQAALARVGVLATAPLGLCFLPAFLLIGIVPVVLGLGADVLAQ